MQGNFNWTPESIEKLTNLWAAGYSASIIARQLGDGCTRSGVCGKVHRLGIARTAPTFDNPRPRHEYPVRRRKPVLSIVPQKQPQIDAPPITLLDNRLITIESLSPGMCKWPIGDYPNMHFCANPTGKTYCDFHRQMAYTKANPSKAKPDRGLANLVRRRY